MAAHSLLGKHNESYSHFAHFREGLCGLWMCLPEDIWICQMETRIWSPRHWEILSLTSLGKMQMKCCRLCLHCTLCFFVLTVLLLLPKFIWRCFLLKIFLWFCQRSCFYKKKSIMYFALFHPHLGQSPSPSWKRIWILKIQERFFNVQKIYILNTNEIQFSFYKNE